MHRLSAVRATSTVAAPGVAGAYTLFLCASYRGGSVMLPVAHAHVLVTSLAAVPCHAACGADDDEGSRGASEPLVVPPLEVDEASALAAPRPQCVVCLSADVDAMIEECGHACFCAACIDQHLRRQKACPVCRGPAAGPAKRIFLP